MFLEICFWTEKNNKEAWCLCVEKFEKSFKQGLIYLFLHMFCIWWKTVNWISYCCSGEQSCPRASCSFYHNKPNYPFLQFFSIHIHLIRTSDVPALLFHEWYVDFAAFFTQDNCLSYQRRILHERIPLSDKFWKSRAYIQQMLI